MDPCVFAGNASALIKRLRQDNEINGAHTMKYLLAAAIVALSLSGLTAGAVSAHHNTQHSQGPCGLNPCPNSGK